MTKRSKKVAIGAILAGSLFALAACDGNDEKGENLMFQDLGECIEERPDNTSKNDWERICRDAIAQSTRDHRNTGPKFRDDDDCEDEYGKCVVYRDDDGGGDFFMPFLFGYMMSSSMNNQGTVRNYHTGYSQPMYQNPRGGYISKSGIKSNTVSGLRRSTTISKAGTYNPRSASSKPQTKAKVASAKAAKAKAASTAKARAAASKSGGFGKSSTARSGGARAGG